MEISRRYKDVKFPQDVIEAALATFENHNEAASRVSCLRKIETERDVVGFDDDKSFFDEYAKDIRSATFARLCPEHDFVFAYSDDPDTFRVTIKLENREDVESVLAVFDAAFESYQRIEEVTGGDIEEATGDAVSQNKARRHEVIRTFTREKTFSFAYILSEGAVRRIVKLARNYAGSVAIEAKTIDKERLEFKDGDFEYENDPDRELDYLKITASDPYPMRKSFSIDFKRRCVMDADMISLKLDGPRENVEQTLRLLQLELEDIRAWYSPFYAGRSGPLGMVGNVLMVSCLTYGASLFGSSHLLSVLVLSLGLGLLLRVYAFPFMLPAGGFEIGRGIKRHEDRIKRAGAFVVGCTVFLGLVVAVVSSI